MFRSEEREKSSYLVIHGSILQVVPLAFAATTSTLLLVLSTYLKREMNQQCIRLKRHPNMSCTARTGGDHDHASG